MSINQNIKLSELNPGDSLLNIEKRGNIEFTVWRYQAGHSVMIIYLEIPGEPNGTEKFYLCFESVEYFDGPMRWEAENLYVSTRKECASILMKMKAYSLVSHDLLPLHFRLVKINTNYDLEVRIIAAKVTVTQDVSSWIGDDYN